MTEKNAEKSETVSPANAMTDAVNILHKRIIGGDELRKKQLDAERAWTFLQTVPCPNVDIEREGTHKLSLTEVLSKYLDWVGSSQAIVIRCSSCDGTVMYKRDGNNVTIMHGCLAGKQAREVYARAELSSQTIASAAKEAARQVVDYGAWPTAYYPSMDKVRSDIAAIIVAAYEKARSK